MELSNVEVCEVNEVAPNVGNENIRQLNDLQLALVGGGIGDVIIG
jgi:hypothetical protein